MFINANFSGDRPGNNERREQVLLLQGPREPAARTTRDPRPVRGPPPGLRGGVLQTHSVLPLCQVNDHFMPSAFCVALTFAVATLSFAS